MEKLIQSPWTHKTFTEEVTVEPDFERSNQISIKAIPVIKSNMAKIQRDNKNRRLVCEVLMLRRESGDEQGKAELVLTKRFVVNSKLGEINATW